MTSGLIYALIALGVIIFLAVVLVTMYVKAPPSVAFILSGLRKEPRVLIGTGGFKVPLIERLDKTFLGQISVDVKTALPVPTHDFIDVMVDAVCKVRALPTPEGIRLAAKNFLNMTPDQIAASVKDSLDTNTFIASSTSVIVRPAIHAPRCVASIAPGPPPLTINLPCSVNFLDISTI